MLRCPACPAPLARHGKTYRCEGGHSFDVARSGYVNLFRSTVGRARGDDRDMLRSRRAFLEAGHYLPLMADLTGRVPGSAGIAPSLKALDVGCGDGYFTAGLARVAPDGSEVWGMDIRKQRSTSPVGDTLGPASPLRAPEICLSLIARLTS